MQRLMALVSPRGGISMGNCLGWFITGLCQSYELMAIHEVLRLVCGVARIEPRRRLCSPDRVLEEGSSGHRTSTVPQLQKSALWPRQPQPQAG